MTSLNFYDLTSSFVFSQLVDVGNQSIPSLEVYPVHLSKDTNNAISIMVAGNTIYARKKIAGVSSTVGSTVAYDSSIAKWFRIRESGGVTYWEYATSPTGTWTEIAHAANPLAISAIKAEVVLGTWQAEASTTTAKVDNYNVLPGALQFTWKGYTWNKRIHIGDPANWHDFSTNNIVLPDVNDYIKLKITNPSLNAPFGAEIFSAQRGFGYGTYTTVIDARLDNVHAAAAFGGLFTFDFTDPPAWREIDVDEVRNYAGHPNKRILKSHVWNNAGVREFITDDMDVPADSVQTHRMIWEPGRIVFDSFIGEGVGGVNYFHAEHTTHVPTPGLERVHFNIWVDTSIAGYLAVTPLDVIIRNFTYTASSPSSSPSPSASISPSLSPSASRSPSASLSPSSSISPSLSPSSSISASVSPSSSASPSPVIWELSTDYFDVLVSIVYQDEYTVQNTAYTDKYALQNTQYQDQFTDQDTQYIRTYPPTTKPTNS